MVYRSSDYPGRSYSRFYARVVGGPEPQYGVEQVLSPKDILAQPKHSLNAKTSSDILRLIEAQTVWLEMRIGYEEAHLEIGVLHEEPSHQVVLIADTGRMDVIGRQQQSGVLDRSGSQNVHACLYR